MLNTSTKSAWYGRLKTANGSSVVIFDPELPEAPKGKLYLYNVDRGAIIKYSEPVVSPLLEDIDQSERKELVKILKKQFKTARKEFLQDYGSTYISAKSKSPSVNKDKKPAEPVDFDSDSEEESDEDWVDDAEII